MSAPDLFGSVYHFKKLLLNRYQVSVKRRLVLQACLGGLGDTLFMSHLPRIAKESGIREVLISNRSIYRDANYPALIWEPNPYVDGSTDERGLDIAVNPRVRPGNNLIDEYMLLAGFDDGTRLHEPEIYRKFEPNPEWRDLVVYDPNYITAAGALTPQSIAGFFAREGLQPDAQLKLRARTHPCPGVTTEIATQNIFEFCRLIVSCRALYCLTTGTATLAAALGKPVTVLYSDGVDTRFHHSRLHRYVRL